MKKQELKVKKIFAISIALISLPVMIFAGEYEADRYTKYRTGASSAELHPLSVVTQLNFPNRIDTVLSAIDYALQTSGYQVDWSESNKARKVLKDLTLPQVHRELSLMTLAEALEVLAGPAWEIKTNSVERVLTIHLAADAESRREAEETGVVGVRPLVEDKPGIGSLEEVVSVHYSHIAVKDLIEILLPGGWIASYEVPAGVLNTKVTSHAESSRRAALTELFKEINLKAIFYPGEGIALIVSKTDTPIHRLPATEGSGEFTRSSYIEPTSPESPSALEEVDKLIDDARKLERLLEEENGVPK